MILADAAARTSKVPTSDGCSKKSKAKVLTCGCGREGSSSLDETMEKWMNIDPNPATNLAIVKFNAGNSSEVSLEITDLGGKSISIQNIATNTGTNAVEIDVQNLAKGLYIIHLITGEERISRQLVIL